MVRKELRKCQDRDQKKAGQRPEFARKDFRKARTKVINSLNRDKKRLAHPSGEEGGGNFLVQMISTCLRCAERKGGGPHPVVQSGGKGVKHKAQGNYFSWRLKVVGWGGGGGGPGGPD